MANTLTNIIPTLHESLQVVSRELTGMIPAVSINSNNVERAGKGQTISIDVVGSIAAGNITPAVTPPDDGDYTATKIDLTISKARRVPVRWSGEDEKILSNGDRPQKENITRRRFEQAFRTLANEVETDLCGSYKYFSRGYGTAGDTPFASTLADAAQMKKLLDDNGAPAGDRHMILNTNAGVNMRSLTSLSSVNQSGDSSLLRSGSLGNIFGFNVGESAQIITHTAGTGASATTDTTGYAIGSTTITLASAGTGTIIAGDLITFAGDTNKYLVTSGDADVSGGGTITIAAPGLRKAIAASATAITVVEDATTVDYTANAVFDRSAIVLAVRPPASPSVGDLAIDRYLVSDPNSPLMFEVSVYPQYRQVQYEVSLAWGFAVVNPEHTGILIG